ncbi:MAG: TRIC cation channel family protein, partial [Bacteroidaceae bacterium]|nr:TRIC cation channel family protein [Bacteroidaceae bacterium]
MEFTTIFDFIGTFAFAISGVRLAARKNFDLFGAYVVGFVTAVGGGTLRDLMLGTTPFWMTTPYYVIITGVALLTVIVLKKWLVRFDSTFFIFDAIGLGFFTVVGLEKSMAADFPMWINIIMGCKTGATGGIKRDILLN